MKLRWLAAAALHVAVPAALACGVCAEDRVAATYDYAAEQRAVGAGQSVVYCALDGRYDAAKVKKAALRVRGVDPSTLRISTAPGAVSFTLDTKRQSAQAAVRALQAGVPSGTRLTLLKVVSAR